MQTLILFWSAVLFVLSSGLIYYERFRRNKLVVGIAVALAVASSISFVYGMWPAAYPDPQAQVAAPDAVANASAAADDPFARDCNWSGGETVTACLERMRSTHSAREANYIVFNSRGAKALLDDSQFESAVDYFTVAIQNSENPGTTPARFLRGVARVYAEDFPGALSDCDAYQKSGAMETASLLAKLQGAAGPKGLMHLCRGISLSELGRHKEAIPELDSAINGGVDDLQLYEARMISRKEVGDVEGSDSDFQIWWARKIDALKASHARKGDGSGNASAAPSD